MSRGRFAYTLDTESGVPWSDEIVAYTDDALFAEAGVRILFTERSGGASVGPFASLDMAAPNVAKGGPAYEQGSLGTCDYFERADFNRAALARALELLHQVDCPLVCPEQVHGDCIVSVPDKDTAYNQAREQAREGADAVEVACIEVAALLRFADCLPLILVAPAGAFSVVHCGWRGVVAHLASKAVKSLAKTASCDASELNAYIGPYIHKECFEVGEDTAQIFAKEFGESVLERCEGSKGLSIHADMGASIVQDLCAAGVVPERIADIDMCTVCNNDRFFSYRAQDGVCGRHAAFAVRLS